MKTSVDRGGRTDLHYAAMENNTAKVKRLLAAGYAVGAADKAGLTPLHFAAQGYSVDAGKLLIEHGAPVDATDSHGNTPLFRAVFESNGRGDFIRLLRKAGADPNRKNKHGINPLSLARDIANFDVGQFFSDLPE